MKKYLILSIIIVISCILLATATYYLTADDFRITVFTGTESDISFAILMGADVNSEDDSGFTPLMYVIANQSEFVEKQLSSFTGVKVFNYSKRDNLSVIKLLIDAGADYNHIYQTDYNLLSFALTYENFPSFELLLDKGVDCNLKDEYNQTVLYEVIKDIDNDKIAVKLIKKLIASGIEVLHDNAYLINDSAYFTSFF